MVKSQTDNDALESLVSELKILIHLGPHLNVVNLIGAYTQDIAAGDIAHSIPKHFILKQNNYFQATCW